MGTKGKGICFYKINFSTLYISKNIFSKKRRGHRPSIHKASYDGKTIIVVVLSYWVRKTKCVVIQRKFKHLISFTILRIIFPIRINDEGTFPEVPTIVSSGFDQVYFFNIFLPDITAEHLPISFCVPANSVRISKSIDPDFIKSIRISIGSPGIVLRNSILTVGAVSSCRIDP